LLNKFLKNTISRDERNVLEKFEQDLKSKQIEPNFSSDIEKAAMQKLLWWNISDGINVESKKWQSTNWVIAASVAAIFIGALSISYLFTNDSSAPSSDLTSENVITLQLEDGSLKTIEDNGTAEITNNDGVVLGRQKGNKLIYTKKGKADVLVHNTINVPYGKTFQLQLSDGTIVHLNAGSSIKYPVKFLEGMNRQVTISGEVYMDVKTDSLHPFIASANTINVRVLGTQFNISAYPEDKTTDVVLVEGSVSLYAKRDEFNVNVEENTVLVPGLKGSYNAIENEFVTNEVNTEVYTSWMDGKLIFRNMEFRNILKKLERHYDVTIVNKNTELTNRKFNANFGSEPIHVVLDELKTNYGIDYEILEDNTVLIN